MRCINYEFDTKQPANVGTCILYADTTPQTLPLTLAGVTGTPDVTPAPVIRPGSLLVIGSSGELYIMNETSTSWTKFGGGE